MNKLTAAFRVASVLAIAAPAAAQTTYTDRAAFNAATSGRTVVDFNDQAADSNTVQAQPYMTGGVTFNATGQIFTIGSGSGFDGGDQYGSGYLLWTGGGPNTLTVTLPSASTAFGFDYIPVFEGDPSPYSVVANGVTSTFTPGANVQFFGMTTAAPITSLTITSAPFPTLDNFTFGTTAVAAAPEPATWGLMILGFGAVGGVLRRKRRATSGRLAAV